MSTAFAMFAVVPWPPRVPLAASGDDALIKIVGFVVLGVIVLVVKAVQAVRDAVKTQQGKGQRPAPPRRQPVGPQQPVPPWQQRPAPPQTPQQRSRKGGRSRPATAVPVPPRPAVVAAPKSPPPLPATVPTPQRGVSVAARLVRPQNLRAAVLLSEILKPPVSLREDERRT